jgi:hypothetical protein
MHCWEAWRCRYSFFSLDTASLLVMVNTTFLHMCRKSKYRTQCKENPSYVFLFWKLHSLSPNFHIHVSVSDLYISMIGPHISLQQNRQTDPGNI